MTTITALTKPALLRYVSFAVNDAGDAMHIKNQELLTALLNRAPLFLEQARIVGWTCGFEPMCVLVYSYLPGVTMDEDEAIELAEDYMRERNWFADPANTAPDFVL